jgi:hypothetical protein
MAAILIPAAIPAFAAKHRQSARPASYLDALAWCRNKYGGPAGRDPFVRKEQRGGKDVWMCYHY